MKELNTKDINLDYYLADSPGRADYWRLMAAPRFRMSTFIRILKENPPASVVDLGCGSGELLREIHSHFPGVRRCGIDLSTTLIDADRDMDPDVEWYARDLDTFQEFAETLEGKFDAVMASEILEHLDHPVTFLKNALQLAKPGTGKLILSTQSGRIWETERFVGHRTHFTVEKMRGVLEDSGWIPLGIWNAGFPFHNLAKRFANLRPRSTIRAFSGKPYNAMQRAICYLLRAAYRFNSERRGSQLFAVAVRGD